MKLYRAIALILLTNVGLFGCTYTPEIRLLQNTNELGDAAAEHIASRIREKQKEKKSPIVLGLATGSSPIPTYKALRKIFHETDLDLSDVITFNLDEYIGLPREHPESYYSFMFDKLFNDLLYTDQNLRGIKKENIHIPKGAVANEQDLSDDELVALTHAFPSREIGTLTQDEQFWIAKARADAYEKMIQEQGPIDLQILGIGRNGHIGFCEPNTSFDSETMCATLTQSTREANASFFDGNMDEVPRYAITMGIKTILQADEILLIATGDSKAAIMGEVLSGPISEKVPATALRLHPHVSFYLDEAAAKFVEHPHVCFK